MLSPGPEAGITSALEALREATRSRHVKLASCRAMARLFDPDYSVSEYRDHLGRLLGLFEPLEHAVASVAGPSHLVRSIRRVRDLREDLSRMGAGATEIDAFERCPCLPPIAAEGVHGYAYVALGSLLGAKIIVKQLRTVLGQGASFGFYGDEKGRYEGLWRIFLQNLEENGRNDIPAICLTAAGIFDAYEAWFSQ